MLIFGSPGLITYIGPAIAVFAAASGAWFTQKRTNPEIRKTDAETARTEAETGTAELNLLKDLRAETERMRKEMVSLRDRVLAAEALTARADAVRAQAQADLAVVLAKSSQERHDLKEQVAIRDGRIKILEDKVDMLESADRRRRREEDNA